MYLKLCIQYYRFCYYCEAFIEETVIHRNLFDYLELAYKYNLDYATNVTIQTLLDNFDALFNQVHEGSCELNGEYCVQISRAARRTCGSCASRVIH